MHISRPMGQTRPQSQLQNVSVKTDENRRHMNTEGEEDLGDVSQREKSVKS